MVEKRIRGKKFRRFLIQNAYPVAIDGTQKLGGDTLWGIEMLERTHGQGESARTQYDVYVLEASLSFSNGLVIPLCSEFLEYGLGDSARRKQDCEQRAFERLAAWLKQRFPRLPLLLLLDGLYATGPVIARCREYNWDFMIVLQDGSLGSVWAEFRGLLPLQPRSAGALGHRERLPGRKTPGLSLRTPLRPRLERHARLPCADAPGPSVQHPRPLRRLPLKGFYARLGVRGMIAFVRSSFTGPWLESAAVKAAMERPLNLRLE